MTEVTITLQLSPGFTVHISDNFDLEEPGEVKGLLSDLCLVLQEYGPDLVQEARETMNAVSKEAMERIRIPDRVLREDAAKNHEKERQALDRAAAAREKALAARIEELIQTKGYQRSMAVHMAENEFLEAERKRIAEIRGW